MPVKSREPALIARILEWNGLWLIARIALVSAFILGGFTKLTDFPGAIAEQEHFGLNPGWLWATFAILIEIGGSALVIFDTYLWLGAGALGVLTAVATYVANDFWHMEGHEHFVAINSFFEHVGLIAGLVLAAIISSHGTASRQSSVIRKE